MSKTFQTFFLEEFVIQSYYQAKLRNGNVFDKIDDVFRVLCWEVIRLKL